MYMNDYILIAIDAFLEAAEVEVKPTYRSPEQPAALKAFCQRWRLSDPSTNPEESPYDRHLVLLPDDHPSQQFETISDVMRHLATPTINGTIGYRNSS